MSEALVPFFPRETEKEKENVDSNFTVKESLHSHLAVLMPVAQQSFHGMSDITLVRKQME